MEGLLYYSFLADENLGYMQNIATIDPDKTLFLEETKTNILYYERANMHEFLEYVSANFEPILFTTCKPVYANFMIK